MSKSRTKAAKVAAEPKEKKRKEPKAPAEKKAEAEEQVEHKAPELKHSL